MENFVKKLLELLTSSRFKSFYWRTGGMAASGFLTLIAENMGALDLPGLATVIAGLAIGEITKAINNKVGGKDTGFVKETE